MGELREIDARLVYKVRSGEYEKQFGYREEALDEYFEDLMVYLRSVGFERGDVERAFLAARNQLRTEPEPPQPMGKLCVCKRRRWPDPPRFTRDEVAVIRHYGGPPERVQGFLNVEYPEAKTITAKELKQIRKFGRLRALDIRIESLVDYLARELQRVRSHRYTFADIWEAAKYAIRGELGTNKIEFERTKPSIQDCSISDWFDTMLMYFRSRSIFSDKSTPIIEAVLAAPPEPGKRWGYLKLPRTPAITTFQLVGPELREQVLAMGRAPEKDVREALSLRPVAVRLVRSGLYEAMEKEYLLKWREYVSREIARLLAYRDIIAIREGWRDLKEKLYS
jgi:hypothetical protein